jgi:hypothetical protein
MTSTTEANATTSALVPTTQPWEGREIGSVDPDAYSNKPKDGRNRAPGDSPGAQKKRAQIEAGLICVIEEVHFGDRRMIVCICGWSCVGAKSDSAQGRAWEAHKAESRISHSGPVERITREP